MSADDDGHALSHETQDLRIGAVFVIIVASSLGVFPPIIMKLTEEAMQGLKFSCAKVFGGAVILTTGSTYLVEWVGLCLFTSSLCSSNTYYCILKFTRFRPYARRVDQFFDSSTILPDRHLRLLGSRAVHVVSGTCDDIVVSDEDCGTKHQHERRRPRGAWTLARCRARARAWAR